MAIVTTPFLLSALDTGALLRGTSDGPAVAVGSPAEKAGLLAEDIILEVNGRRISKDNSLGGEISKYNVGDTVTLTVNRDGKELELKATLAKRPTE